MSTEARPTSEPVPDVVGTATTGAMPATLTRVNQSSRSSKSQIGRVWPTISAMALAASSALPPPNAITPSWPPARNAATPAVTFASTGFGCTSENTSQPRPASRQSRTAFATIGSAASPASVTSSGRCMPSERQCSGSSTMRPAPNLMLVG